MATTFESSIENIVSVRSKIHKAERLADEAISKITKIAKEKEDVGKKELHPWFADSCTSSRILKDKAEAIEKIKKALALEIVRIKEEVCNPRKPDYCPSCGAELK